MPETESEVSDNSVCTDSLDDSIAVIPETGIYMPIVVLTQLNS